MAGKVRGAQSGCTINQGDAQMAANGIRVMVVDDEAHIRAVVAGAVTALGGEVVAEVSDGAQAVAVFARLRPQVVILDINMPTLRGDEALKQIRAIDPGTVVVMMTAQDTIDTVQDCLNQGASHYILKNNRAEELYRLLAEIWGELQAEPREEAAPRREAAA